MKIKFDRFAITAFVLKLWRDLLNCLQMATVQLEGLICDSTAHATPLAAVKLASESVFEFT